MNNKDVWATLIDNIMVWRANNWYSLHQNKDVKTFLRLHYDQMMIMTENNVIESININNKLKGIYKDDIMILIFTSTAQSVRKIKFQIKRNVEGSYKYLGQHFPIINHNSKQVLKNFRPRYQNIEETMKKALENSGKEIDSIHMPPFDVEISFVKLCLLDPNFPQLISQIEKIINNLK